MSPMHLDISAVRKLALDAVTELDGFHGDPAKRANWIRERWLAKVVLELVARLDSALRAPIEVES